MIGDRNNTTTRVSSAISRRAAIGLLGAVVMVAPRSVLAKAAPAAVLGTWPVGVQLWTVNAQLQKDAPGTLKQLKATGYDLVETAGLAGLSAAAFRKLLDDNGLVCRSAHASM